MPQRHREHRERYSLLLKKEPHNPILDTDFHRFELITPSAKLFADFGVAELALRCHGAKLVEAIHELPLLQIFLTLDAGLILWERLSSLDDHGQKPVPTS